MQRPPLQEYIDRHPELAGEIREVFPAMAMMENIALADESLEGDATGDLPARRLPPLEQLGDYRILREVGRGGMGVVYEAEQVSLGRHVALKVLPPQMLRDAKTRRRFEREARAAAKLHHTNIVPVFGVGEQGETPYYVMQFIQGLGLDAVLEELKRLRTGEAAASGRRRRLATMGRDVSAADVARSLLTGRLDAQADREVRGRQRSRLGRHGRLRLRLGPRVVALLVVAHPARRAAPWQGQAADLLAERGADRRPGGRRPGLRAHPGDPPPRHQAVQPAARHPRHRLGDRLRPGQGGRPAEPDAHRRHPRHAAVHAARGLRGQGRQPGRRLRAGPDALRAAGASGRRSTRRTAAA